MTDTALFASRLGLTSGLSERATGGMKEEDNSPRGEFTRGQSVIPMTVATRNPLPAL